MGVALWSNLSMVFGLIDFPGAFEIFDHAAGTRTTFCAADGLVTTSIFTALSERIDLYQAMNSLSN
jgi:hypothetical protein